MLLNAISNSHPIFCNDKIYYLNKIMIKQIKNNFHSCFAYISSQL